MERLRTKRIFENLSQILPGGVNSPVRSCLAMEQMPMVVESGHGAILTDVDGNKYIDYCCSWGALIHGHAHPEILKAVQTRMEKGTSFGITTEIEGELGKQIIKHYKSVEKIRFISSGTEATMTAARLARGFTKKNVIIKFNGNYHGHADFFLVQAGSGVFNLSATSSSAGIPEDIIKHTVSLPYNDIEACQKAFSHYKGEIAAVILEPIAGNMGVVPATREFMHYLRAETKRMGILLIFDEVITGFRVGLKGAQEYYQIIPDITCFGKIIGAGFPVAALGGRKEIMDHLAPLGPVYQAGTLSGNPIAMEAGVRAIQLLEKDDFYESLLKKTEVLLQPIQKCIEKNHLNACIQQVGSMFTLFFGRKKVSNMEDAKKVDMTKYARFFRYLFERGVYIPPLANEAWFISSAHEEIHLKKTSELIIDFLLQDLRNL